VIESDDTYSHEVYTVKWTTTFFSKWKEVFETNTWGDNAEDALQRFYKKFTNGDELKQNVMILSVLPVE
jgi:hypothetical protein